MEPLQPKLRGKVALVTGAARGLGRAYAVRLARLGADVVVNDVNLEAWREFDEDVPSGSVAAECASFGVRSFGHQADVRHRSEVDAMVARIVAEFGSLDIVVNNAGGMLRPWPETTPLGITDDDTQFLLEVNLKSVIHCCQAAVPHMRERGWGRIVNISSQAGVRGSAGNLCHYGIAKAGVIHYTRCLAAEVGPFGITANCLAPALIRTSRASAQFPGREAMAEGIPLRRLGVPEDCAKAVEFFVSDLGDYITGQVLGVCGGVLLYPI